MQRAQVGEHGENAAVAVLALGHTKLLQDMGAVGLRFRAGLGAKGRSSSVARASAGSPQRVWQKPREHRVMGLRHSPPVRRSST
jgi:hypothetical protein